MSQVRLSIPFIGGVTKVYEQQEFNKEMKAVAEKAKWTGLVLLGVAFVAAEVVTRKTADVLSDAARTVADYHDHVVEPALAKNDQKKIDHAYKLVDEAEKYANGAGTCCVA